MPAGFQVFNDQGVVIIDSETRNMVLVAKYTSFSWVSPGFGVSATPTGSTGKTSYTASVVDHGLDALYCIRSPNLAIGFQRNLGMFTLASSPPTGVEVYVFKPMPVVVPNVGLVVYDASGNQTYSTDYRAMQVLHVATVPTIGTGAGQTAEFVLATNAGRGPYAACLGRARIGEYMFPGATSSNTVWDGVRTPSDNASVRVSPIAGSLDFGIGNVQTPGVYAASNYNVGSTLLAVSVTGM